MEDPKDKKIEDVKSDGTDVPSNGDTPEEKSTNKTFTQSEYDKALKRDIEKLESNKYANIQEKLTELETLKKEKSDRELEEKTEIEKAEVRLKEQSDHIQKLETQNQSLAMEQVKQKVLGETKYASLPRAYKEMVKVSNDIQAVRESADGILEEYKQDFGISQTFGEPLPKNKVEEKKAVIETPDDFRKSLKEKIKNAMQKRMQKSI